MVARLDPPPGATLDGMTSPDAPVPPVTPVPACAPVPAAAPVSVGEPGELIAATPVLLGFTPRSSLVAMALGGASGARLGLTLRIDLPPPEHLDGTVEAVVRGILLDDPAAVVVIVVAPGGDAGPPAIELVERVVTTLEVRGVDVPIALWSASTESGSRWRCYDACACTGVVPRPEETPLVVAALAEGRVVRRDRTELQRLVAPADPERIRRREAKLVAAIDAEVDAGVDAGANGAAERASGRFASRHWRHRGPGADVVAGIAALDAAVDAAALTLAAGTAEGPGGPGTGEGWLDDERVLALVRALRLPVVRDAAIASCTGSRPEVMEELWAALTRETPDPEAAEPAALLALSALLRGDGALANVALERAEAAWPAHRLTAILRGLVRAGARPDELRACLAEGLRPPFDPRMRR